MKQRKQLWFMLASVFLAGIAAATLVNSAGLGAANAAVAGDSERYPYGSAAFNQFITDSYGTSASASANQFYQWMERTYAQNMAATGQRSTLNAAVAARRAQLSTIQDDADRARAELRVAAWVHHSVKTAIPRFSLDRGFEFFNVVRKGERQCFLQSVLIAGLLQQMGVRAGVVMVYRNEHGGESNNGHAVTLVKLRDGRDALVDASDTKPISHHGGLFVAMQGYRYVEPIFDGVTSTITGYRPAGTAAPLAPNGVRPLDIAFIRSQFFYYRGERAAGGPLARRPSPRGLEVASNRLRTAMRLCPENPLPAYMLGYISLKSRRLEAARQQIMLARGLYQRFGWVPAGVQDSLLHTISVPISSPGTTPPPVPAVFPAPTIPTRTG